VNGRVARGHPANEAALGPHWSKYAERNQLFANDGTGKFTDVSPQNKAFCGAANVARGLAMADLRGNGGLDLVVTTVGGPARVYRNVAPERGHWLLVRALDPRLKRDAYGAEVRIEQGGKKWWRQIDAGGSYLSSSDPRAHFGLGAVDRVEHIEVLWPDGLREEFACGAVDRQLTLRRGEGRAQ
jgi:enediyne biosynthesis protein E4